MEHHTESEVTSNSQEEQVEGLKGNKHWGSATIKGPGKEKQAYGYGRGNLWKVWPAKDLEEGYEEEVKAKCVWQTLHKL